MAKYLIGIKGEEESTEISAHDHPTALRLFSRSLGTTRWSELSASSKDLFLVDSKGDSFEYQIPNFELELKKWGQSQVTSVFQVNNDCKRFEDIEPFPQLMLFEKALIAVDATATYPFDKYNAVNGFLSSKEDIKIVTEELNTEIKEEYEKLLIKRIGKAFQKKPYSRQFQDLLIEIMSIGLKGVQKKLRFEVSPELSLDSELKKEGLSIENQPQILSREIKSSITWKEIQKRLAVDQA